ncbi:MAG: DsbA family protein [Gammaproteobacteria bacterium]
MKLVYFANPMCSWCWGFAPVIQKIKESKFVENISLILTPFRIDTTQPMDDELRNYILGQWHKVHQTTSQPFDFSFAMPAGFIYNTRLVCLAIKSFKKQIPELEFKYLHALQQAYYTENLDLTNQEMLINIANSFSVDNELFIRDLNNKNITEELEEDFSFCQHLNVQSYPTLMYEKFDSYAILSSGYTAYDELLTRIEVVLDS